MALTENTLPLSDEVQWLLTALGAGPPARRMQDARKLVARGLDWARLEVVARDNQVLPALAPFTGPMLAHGMPQAFHDRCGQAYRRAARQNLALLIELARVLRLFEQASLPVIPFKGPLFAREVYGDLGLRPSGDIDLLVPFHDATKARHLLERDGYRLRPSVIARSEEEYLWRDNEFTLDHPVIPEMVIEIHWRFLSPGLSRHGFEDSLWNRAFQGQFGGIQTWCIPPADMFVTLAMHGGLKHQWRELRWIADIARLLVEWQAIDWNPILTLAARLHAKRITLVGALLAHQLFAAPLPSVLRQAIQRSPRVRSKAAYTLPRLFRDGGRRPDFREWSEFANSSAGFPLPSLGAHPLQARLHYTLNKLTPDYGDHMHMSGIPGAFSFVRYFIKPYRHLRSRLGAMDTRGKSVPSPPTDSES